jgi:hypothetical protein
VLACLAGHADVAAYVASLTSVETAKRDATEVVCMIMMMNMMMAGRSCLTTDETAACTRGNVGVHDDDTRRSRSADSRDLLCMHTTVTAHACGNQREDDDDDSRNARRSRSADSQSRQCVQTDRTCTRGNWREGDDSSSMRRSRSADSRILCMHTAQACENRREDDDRSGIQRSRSADSRNQVQNDHSNRREIIKSMDEQPNDTQETSAGQQRDVCLVQNDHSNMQEIVKSVDEQPNDMQGTSAAQHDLSVAQNETINMQETSAAQHDLRVVLTALAVFDQWSNRHGKTLMEHMLGMRGFLDRLIELASDDACTRVRNLGTQNPGTRNLDTRNPGIHYPGKRNPGIRNPGTRNPGMTGFSVREPRYPDDDDDDDTNNNASSSSGECTSRILRARSDDWDCVRNLAGNLVAKLAGIGGLTCLRVVDAAVRMYVDAAQGSRVVESGVCMLMRGAEGGLCMDTRGAEGGVCMRGAAEGTTGDDNYSESELFCSSSGLPRCVQELLFGTRALDLCVHMHEFNEGGGHSVHTDSEHCAYGPVKSPGMDGVDVSMHACMSASDGGARYECENAEQSDPSKQHNDPSKQHNDSGKQHNGPGKEHNGPGKQHNDPGKESGSYHNGAQVSIPGVIGMFHNLEMLRVVGTQTQTQTQTRTQVTQSPDTRAPATATATKQEILTTSDIREMRIPTELSRCTSLKTLILTQNAISVFPVCVLALRALEVVEMSHNALRELPDGLSVLVELKVLNLSRNRLSCLPCFGSFGALESLNISNNMIR